MSDKITIEKIAELSGVSIATVSRIINNKDKVKTETKEKVLSIMQELHFQPKGNNALADSSSNIILMCVPDFYNPFNSIIISGVQTAAHANGYEVLILRSKTYYTEISDYTNILKQNSIAGILILCSVPNSSLIDELSFKCPVVMCSEYAENYGVSYVSIDDVTSSKMAVNYLISTGCKKIGLINCNENYKYARHREKGYRQALIEAGLEVNENWIAHVSSVDYQLGYSNATSLLSQPNRPDAIFTTSDILGIAAINAAKKLGLRIPEDVSVVGFDNIELSLMSTPTLTTVEQPTFQIGFQSCEILINKIKKPDTIDKQVILDTQLIVRESTKLLNI